MLQLFRRNRISPNQQNEQRPLTQHEQRRLNREAQARRLLDIQRRMEMELLRDEIASRAARERAIEQQALQNAHNEQLMISKPVASNSGNRKVRYIGDYSQNEQKPVIVFNPNVFKPKDEEKPEKGQEPRPDNTMIAIPRAHKGGIVNKPTNSLYKLAKGEMIVPKERVKAVKNAMKKDKLKPIINYV